MCSFSLIFYVKTTLDLARGLDVIKYLSVG